jgi:hypothetical protein
MYLQCCGSPDDMSKLSRPIVSAPREHFAASLALVELRAITIEFNFVHPCRSLGRAAECRKRGRDEVRERGTFYTGQFARD